MRNLEHSIQSIKNYILFLKQRANLSVTLHPISAERLITESELITFNIHDNPYCVFLKTHKKAHEHCISRQSKIIEKCKSGSFCGTCYAGVQEFVYPIQNGETVVGFISVSGYKTNDASGYLTRTAELFDVNENDLLASYHSLKSNAPFKGEIDVLIAPLCDMLELAYQKFESAALPPTDLYQKLCAYIRAHHTEKITTERLCAEFYCSRSKISHFFKTKHGKSIPEYVTELRVRDAATLLRCSSLGVTEIAYAVGFEDRNYFCNVFKKATGVSPTTYRKENNP